jgi:hypothetical protein
MAYGVLPVRGLAGSAASRCACVKSMTTTTTTSRLLRAATRALEAATAAAGSRPHSSERGSLASPRAEAVATLPERRLAGALVAGEARVVGSSAPTRSSQAARAAAAPARDSSVASSCCSATPVPAQASGQGSPGRSSKCCGSSAGRGSRPGRKPRARRAAGRKPERATPSRVSSRPSSLERCPAAADLKRHKRLTVAGPGRSASSWLVELLLPMRFGRRAKAVELEATGEAKDEAVLARFEAGGERPSDGRPRLLLCLLIA